MKLCVVSLLLTVAGSRTVSSPRVTIIAPLQGALGQTVLFNVVRQFPTTNGSLARELKMGSVMQDIDAIPIHPNDTKWQPRFSMPFSMSHPETAPRGLHVVLRASIPNAPSDCFLDAFSRFGSIPLYLAAPSVRRLSPRGLAQLVLLMPTGYMFGSAEFTGRLWCRASDALRNGWVRPCEVAADSPCPSLHQACADAIAQGTEPPIAIDEPAFVLVARTTRVMDIVPAPPEQTGLSLSSAWDGEPTHEAAHFREAQQHAAPYTSSQSLDVPPLTVCFFGSSDAKDGIRTAWASTARELTRAHGWRARYVHSDRTMQPSPDFDWLQATFQASNISVVDTWLASPRFRGREPGKARAAPLSTPSWVTGHLPRIFAHVSPLVTRCDVGQPCHDDVSLAVVGRLCALLQDAPSACSDPTEWLLPFSQWLVHAVEGLVAALRGCDVTVTAAGDSETDSLMALVSSLAGARAMLLEVCGVNNALPCKQSLQVASLLSAHSVFARDATVVECARQGVPMCRGGRSINGWRGLPPQTLQQLASPADNDIPIRWEGFSPLFCDDDPRATPIVAMPLGAPVANEFAHRSPWLSEVPVGDTLHLAFVGRLSPEKGPGLAIRLAAAIAQRGAFARVIIELHGQGVLGPSLKSLARDLERISGGSLVVEFPGWSAQGSVWERLNRQQAVLVFPTLSSRSETFGMVVIEAMRAGVLVATWGAGGASEMAIRGRTAVLLSSPWDLDVPAREIVQSVTNRSLARSLVANALSFAQGVGSSRASAARYARLLHCLSRCTRGFTDHVLLTLGWEIESLSPSAGDARVHRLCSTACAKDAL
jgi:glycosyltransferase involved in cell wall biosynthesis